MAARADLDPFGFVVACTIVIAPKVLVENTINHGYGIYEGIEEKNGWKIAGNTALLAMDVAPFFFKRSGVAARR